MSPKVTRIDIRAHDRIFSPRGAAALNIGMSQCLAELVANSLDWSMLNEAEASTISDDKKWILDNFNMDAFKEKETIKMEK